MIIVNASIESLPGNLAPLSKSISGDLSRTNCSTKDVVLSVSLSDSNKEAPAASKFLSRHLTI
jgi:hypothetical protein